MTLHSPLLILQGPLGSDLQRLRCFLQTLQPAQVFLLISYFLPLPWEHYYSLVSLIIMALIYGMLSTHETLSYKVDVHRFKPNADILDPLYDVKTQVLVK